MDINRLQSSDDIEIRIFSNARTIGGDTESLNQAGYLVELYCADQINAGGAVNTTEMIQLWSRLSDTDFLDLENCARRSIGHSTRPKPANGAAGAADASALMVANIDALQSLKEKIEKSLNGAAYRKLQERCALFGQTLSRESSKYKHTFAQELQDLCVMTINIKSKL
jgi:protoporphyrinogen oxidase